MEKSCNTCTYFSDFLGECSLGFSDKWQARDCDMNECPEYKTDPFYEKLEVEFIEIGDKESVE